MSREERAAERYALRAGLRNITSSSREESCGTRIISAEGAKLVADRSDPSAPWRVMFRGVLRCGHIWSCPVCSEKLRVERSARAERAMVASRGRWQMVTLTASHRKGHRLEPVLRGLKAAWRKARQGGALQRIYKASVSASVTATEVTYGANGWHPHIHALLRTSQWDPSSKRELFARWHRAVGESLGPEHLPSEERGVHWSRSPDVDGDHDAGRVARYVTKLGMEVSGVAKKAKGASLTPWGIAAHAARGSHEHERLWREYVAATRGKRMLELDDRAQRWAVSAHAIVGEEYACEQLPESTGEHIEVPVLKEHLTAIRRAEYRRPTIVHEMLSSVSASADPTCSWGEQVAALGPLLP